MKGIIHRLLCLLALFIMASNILMANTPSENQPKKGIQLAYFIGSHTNNYRYYQPDDTYYSYRHHHRRPHYYWRSWYYNNHHCAKSCLINGWNGRIIRCSRRC